MRQGLESKLYSLTFGCIELHHGGAAAKPRVRVPALDPRKGTVSHYTSSRHAVYMFCTCLIKSFACVGVVVQRPPYSHTPPPHQPKSPTSRNRQKKKLTKWLADYTIFSHCCTCAMGDDKARRGASCTVLMTSTVPRASEFTCVCSFPWHTGFWKHLSGRLNIYHDC